MRIVDSDGAPLRGMDRWGAPAGMTMLGVGWIIASVNVAQGSPLWTLQVGAATAEAVLPIGVAVLILLDPYQFVLKQPPHLRDSLLFAMVQRRFRLLFRAAVVISAVALLGALVIIIGKLLDPRVPGGLIFDIVVLAPVGGLTWFALNISRSRIDPANETRLKQLEAVLPYVNRPRVRRWLRP
jgi:hypothetical protein